MASKSRRGRSAGKGDARGIGRGNADPTFGAVLAAQAEQDDDPYKPVVLDRVYFALDSEAAQVKIGWSRDVDKRITSLSRERGRPIELLGTITAGYDLERCLHQRFRPYRREAQE